MLQGEFETSEPNSQGDGHEEDQTQTSFGRSSKPMRVECNAAKKGSNDLGQPVEHAVHGLGTGREKGSIDTILLIGVEPVGREEHGEQCNDIWFIAESSPESTKFALPARILLDNDTAAIVANNVFGIAQAAGEQDTGEHHRHEPDICAVIDIFIGVRLHVLYERNLRFLAEVRQIAW